MFELSSNFFLGIDPGARGALVFISEAGTWLDLISAPYTDNQLCNWLDSISNKYWRYAPKGCKIHTAIECIKPTYGPGAGKAEAAKLYGSYTALKMALAAKEYEYEEVESKDVWYYLGIGARRKKESTTKWKERHKIRAQELSPNLTVTLTTCDALLIAEYIRRKTLGILIADPEPVEDTPNAFPLSE